MVVAPIPHRGPKNAFTRTLARLGDWDLLSVFDPKPPRPYPRQVLVNSPLPPHAVTTAPKVPIPGFSKSVETIAPNGTVVQGKQSRGWGTKTVPSEGWIYQSNQVLTSKYNIITFLPRNLLEQFRRVANVFFLGEPLSLVLCSGAVHPVEEQPRRVGETVGKKLLEGVRSGPRG